MDCLNVLHPDMKIYNVEAYKLTDNGKSILCSYTNRVASSEKAIEKWFLGFLKRKNYNLDNVIISISETK